VPRHTFSTVYTIMLNWTIFCMWKNRR